MKTILVIDGENFKKKILSVLKYHDVLFSSWELFDFQRLLKNVLKEITPDKTIFYGAKLKQYKESIEKSQQLIQEQRHLKTHLTKQGVTVVLSGNVQRHATATHTGKSVYSFKEKGVDVQMAVDIVCLACDKEATCVILASSDSDLQPAIREAKKRGVFIIYLGFDKNPNKGIMYTSNRTILIKDSEVIEAYQAIHTSMENLTVETTPPSVPEEDLSIK